ncbi:CPBP family intramembrane glutamic endopeptidase [Paenibacillus campi]|uniref:CPBP family intramembrane glutamic endopeptidase n=1 Tax=Paenibacillus campi TaxID=3106031 RepID=UPI002AFE7B33|nr:CPBP family intramembrane glutamic endopeptidase [Paenibacillus sp. SGZ-1009]
MNPIGKPVQLKPNYKWLGLLAVIALVIFLFTQVFPLTASDTLEAQQTASITEQQAIESADAFKASLPLDEQDRAALATQPTVTYVTDAELSGYIARDKLNAEYASNIEKWAPYDVFRVHYQDSNYAADIDVHMNNGNVVGFHIRPTQSGNNLNIQSDDGSLSLADKEQLASPLLSKLGYDLSKLKLQTTDDESGLDYIVPDAKLGASTLHVKLIFENDQVAAITPKVTPPASYTNYIESQTRLATWLTFLGYGLFTIVLGVLAIVFASLKRKHTSFKRGIVLTCMYTAVSMISVFNMLPYLERQYGQSGWAGNLTLLFLVGLQLLLNVMMAILLYFSLVGGDGMWRERGLNMWPRSRELGYGKYVLHSAAVGYLFALILLGVQSIIYMVMEPAFGVFSATDDSSSPYNMVVPALFPLLAWMAGIGEEGVYRLFGIIMLKKLVRNTFVAAAITSIIWALGHTLYPIYPVYSRPIELLIIGLLFSFVFVRYGFIAVVFAHVMFDTILMSLSLMSLGGWANIAIAILYIALPAIVAYIIYLYARDKGVDNAYPPYVPPAPQQPFVPSIGVMPDASHPYYRPDGAAPGELPNDPSRFSLYQESKLAAPPAPAAKTEPKAAESESKSNPTAPSLTKRDPDSTDGQP